MTELCAIHNQLYRFDCPACSRTIVEVSGNTLHRQKFRVYNCPDCEKDFCVDDNLENLNMTDYRKLHLADLYLEEIKEPCDTYREGDIWKVPNDDQMKYFSLIITEVNHDEDGCNINYITKDPRLSEGTKDPKAYLEERAVTTTITEPPLKDGRRIPIDSGEDG